MEEKVAFLLSCIRYKNDGVIDFKAVAKECNIVSAEAASKRFRRLMKDYDICQDGSLTGNEGQSATPKSSKATPKNTPAKSAKKRKLDHSTETHDNTDDEEQVAPVKKNTPKTSRKTSTLAAGKKGKGVAMAPAEFDGHEEASDVSVKAEEDADEV